LLRRVPERRCLRLGTARQSCHGESLVDRGGGSVLGFYSDSVGDESCGFLSSRLAARGGFSGCPQKLPCRRLKSSSLKRIRFVYVFGEAVGSASYELLRAGLLCDSSCQQRWGFQVFGSAAIMQFSKLRVGFGVSSAVFLWSAEVCLVNQRHDGLSIPF
jgi:hypothetical protein